MLPMIQATSQTEERRLWYKPQQYYDRVFSGARSSHFIRLLSFKTSTRGIASVFGTDLTHGWGGRRLQGPQGGTFKAPRSSPGAFPWRSRSPSRAGEQADGGAAGCRRACAA